MTISIIIPVFNTEPYLRRCLDSILSQSFSGFDVLLIDDGSTDASGMICDEYVGRDERIHVIHTENGGVSSARNLGLDNARGEWLFFVDADDWLELDALEVLLNKQKQRNVDVVFGKRLVYETNEPYLWGEGDYQNKEEFVIRMMQRTWDHFITGKLIRHSLFVSNGLRWVDGLDVAEDRYMMALLSYYANSFDSVNSVVYHYERRNINSITNTDNDRKILRNNKQELGNLQLLEQFFQGKESVYNQECTRCVLEQLVINWRAALIHSDRFEYDDIVGVIDKRSEEELRQIRWNKGGFKWWIIHHYFFMKCYRKCGRIFGSVKKRLQVVFCS